MNIYSVVLGAVALLAGRRLFWLLVGVVGFLAGMQFAQDLVPAGTESWIVLAVGCCAGVVGALVAVVAERLAFGLVGFFAGVYLVPVVMQALHMGAGGSVPALVGGVVGAVLALLLMDWAIVAVSSLVGAGAVAQGLPLDPLLQSVVFVVLLVLGFSLQARGLRRR